MRVRDGVLGHVVLNVANLKKSETFYRAIVGMKVSARNRRTKMTFMSFGREHHDVALMELPSGSKARGRQGDTQAAPLLHLCRHERRSRRALSLLRRRKIPIVSGPEILEVAGNRSISFLDPDGNRVEIACNANKFRFDNRRR